MFTGSIKPGEVSAVDQPSLVYWLNVILSEMTNGDYSLKDFVPTGNVERTRNDPNLLKKEQERLDKVR